MKYIGLFAAVCMSLSSSAMQQQPGLPVNGLPLLLLAFMQQPPIPKDKRDTTAQLQKTHRTKECIKNPKKIARHFPRSK